MIRALALGLILALSAVTGASAADPANWTRPNKPYRIVGSVYYVGSEGLSAYLIASSKGHVLLDGGPSAQGAKLIEGNIAALGFKLSDVKILINTHAHFDHAGGLAQLKADTGAKLYASAADRPALEKGVHIGDNDNGPTPFPAVKVDKTVRDNETIKLGETVLTTHLIPGHTPGGTAWSLPVVERGRPLNVVFYSSTSVAGNVLVGNKAYPRIVADYRSSFAKLKTLPADVFLPAHEEQGDLIAKRRKVLRGQADAFIDPTEMGKFVVASEAAFDKELARQQGAAR
ncbi:MAG: subclass metallo-beta-lactamase [Caulobacter sp.]|nr:subclass metallo-beta-lactamase [Caulobacter sp.]